LGRVSEEHTAREQQVLEQLQQGLTNRAIAEELQIKTGTVKIHLKHVFEKTGIRGRHSLALATTLEDAATQFPRAQSAVA
jgi:two-component system nitrate/nitrite response regulator NarL